MKTFEEKFTAWVDGNLTGKELADFQQQLVQVKNGEADKLAANRLGNLLREHLEMPNLRNADFFNHQLMQRIEAEQPRATPPARRVFFWTLPRMAWMGACCLALAAGLYFATVPQTKQQAAAGQEYVARILHTQTGSPGISATAYHDNDQNVTVLWLDGLDYIPASKDIK